MKWLRFNSWSIRFHLLVWSLLPVVVCTCALVGGRVAYVHVREALAEAAVSRDTLSAAGELLQAMLDLETGLRGYALTADPAFLEPYQNGQVHAAQQIERLRELER